MKAASQLREERWQALALSELVPHLPEPQRSRAAQLALNAARYTVHEDDRVPVLAGLAPYPGGELLRDAVADALAITSVSLRTKALEALAQRLAALAPTDTALVHRCWSFALHRVGAFGRGEAVQALTSLACVAIALGRACGEIDVAGSISSTVDEIAEWWP